MKKIEIEIPEQVDIQIQGDTIFAKGPKGESKRKLLDPRFSMKVNGNTFVITTEKFSRKEKKVINTFTAHIKNIIIGVTEGYVYKLKVCSTHFPMTVSIEGDKFIIKNFFGEKIPRKAKIFPEVKVKIEKDILTLEGTNKEHVGQTAANIEQACRITNRDKRIFQDGCWITSKAGKEV